MDLIILIAIISFIIKKIKDSNVDAQSNTRYTMGKRYQRNDRVQRSVQNAQSTQWQTSSQAVHSTNRQCSDVTEQNARWQQAARENIEKARLRAQKKFSEIKQDLEIEDNVDTIYKMPKEVNKTSILERTKANVAEDKVDVTLHTLEAEHNHSERVSLAEHYHPEDIISDNLLGNVEDLIIKGYDGNLCFERDFVGEALDMISRFTAPSEVPDFSGDHDDVA